MNTPHGEPSVIGTGPRGVSVLERLCAQKRKSPSCERLTIHVVDPAAPGAGAVWRTGQSRHPLMNTVASQVTVLTDTSVTMAGPVEEGPSLHEWAQHLLSGSEVPPGGPDDAALAEARALGPDTYPTRAFYGRYEVRGEAEEARATELRRGRLRPALPRPGRHLCRGADQRPGLAPGRTRRRGGAGPRPERAGTLPTAAATATTAAARADRLDIRALAAAPESAHRHWAGWPPRSR